MSAPGLGCVKNAPPQSRQNDFPQSRFHVRKDLQTHLTSAHLRKNGRVEQRDEHFMRAAMYRLGNIISVSDRSAMRPRSK
jgi:hypothetical protein